MNMSENKNYLLRQQRRRCKSAPDFDEEQEVHTSAAEVIEEVPEDEYLCKDSANAGIICSNTDLSLMLSEEKESSAEGLKSVRRKSVTLVRKGMLIRGFLSQDVAVRRELFGDTGQKRRISTGSCDLAMTSARPEETNSGGRRSSVFKKLPRRVERRNSET